MAVLKRNKKVLNPHYNTRKYIINTDNIDLLIKENVKAIKLLAKMR